MLWSALGTSESVIHYLRVTVPGQKIASHFHALGVRCGHLADSQFENISVRYFRSFPLTSGLEVRSKPRHDGIVHPVMLYESW